MAEHDATASRIVERAVREFAAKHGDHIESSRFSPTGIILEVTR